MSKQIIWSPLSVSDFAKILEYLHENWDEKVTSQFIKLTENILEQISINPKQFPVIHKKEKIRKCVLTKHNSMFYRESKSHIDILRFFDARQDPNTLTFK
jgi:plasmid stabilization system protein ParE